ncbi:hypothetical protein N7449_012536 [Penicillium cf. viridicatum]|uniref:Uncharacterized protein n=1 Tax=Penicillium cf. viridicatum TaxID=2972119 RepID=A0A9W9LXA0_9EURO|nr:hypothetical protein N7449_012536 [Penicillium cf. viridicatum]
MPSQLANLPTNAYQCPPRLRGVLAGVRTPVMVPVCPPPLNCPPARPPERPTPPPRQLAPHALLLGARSRRWPPRPGTGEGTACGCGWRGRWGYRGPTARVTLPGPPPHWIQLSSGPLGPGRFYTNPPTPFGV